MNIMFGQFGAFAATRVSQPIQASNWNILIWSLLVKLSPAHEFSEQFSVFTCKKTWKIEKREIKIWTFLDPSFFFF